MKSKRIRLGIFLSLLLFGLFQASNLIKIRIHNDNFYIKENNSDIKVNEFLRLIEHHESEIISIKNDKCWNGEVVFRGNEENLRGYINNLKINNIYVENYRIKKTEELKWFLEIKPV